MKLREALTREERLARAFANANDRLRDYVEQRIAKDAVDVARLYRSSRSTLIDRLRHIYVQFLGDEPSFLKARQSGAGTALDLQIDMTVRELADSLGRHAVSRVSGMLTEQPARVLARLRRLGVPISELATSAQGVLNELTTAVIGGGTFFDRAFAVTDDLRRDVVRGVRQSLLQGETFEQLQKRMYKAFGVDKLDDPHGTAYGSVKHYRNEARRQWNLLMQQQSKLSPGDTIEIWWATIDDRSTPGCVARHGYPVGKDLPPRHYNCRCTIAVFPAGTDLDSFRAEAMAWLEDNGYSRRRALTLEATHAHYVGDKSGPHSHKGGTSDPEGMVQAAGGRFNGIQHVPPMGGKPERNYLMFTDPETHSTGMIPLEDATVERVQAHLKDIRRRFGKESWWWGEREIKSAYDTMNLDGQDGYVYRSVPWQDVPGVVNGSNRGEWDSSLPRVRNAAQPNHVMLFAPRKTYANPRTYRLAALDGALVPLMPERGRWIPLARGFALDSAHITSFDQPRVRFPLDIIQRWPQLRPVTFPVHRDAYTAGVVSPEHARMLTLGTLDPGELPGAWKMALSFDALCRDLLTYPTHQDPYFVTMDRDRNVELIVHLQSGRVVFSPQEFPPDLQAPYTRVAAVAMTSEGLIWSVRPRGKSIYVLPGGHIDPGEKPSEAVVRELKEETGVLGQLERELGRLYRPWSTTIVYIVRPFGHREPVTTPDENDDVALIDINQLVEDEQLFLRRHGIEVVGR